MMIFGSCKDCQSLDFIKLFTDAYEFRTANGPTLLSYQTVARVEAINQTANIAHSTFDWNAINGAARFNPFARNLIDDQNQAIDPEIIGLHA